MKNSYLKVICATAVVVAGLTAQAVQISGGLSIAGAYSTDTGNVGTATKFTAFTGVYIASGQVSGDYATVPTGFGTGPTLTMNGFTFSPFPVGGVVPLWTFTYGGKTYSFDLLAINTKVQGANSLLLSGSGLLRITGLDATAGTFDFSAQQGGGTFSFSASHGAVPDGGTTLAMLGMAFGALALLKRKLS